LVFQAHFFMKIGQGGFGPLGVLIAPVHEQAHTDAAEHSQDPRGIAMAHAAAILSGADIQPLVQSGFDAPVSALRRQPLRGAQAFRGAAGQQILEVGLVAQALPENDRALRGGGKAGLLGADGRGAEGADFSPAPVFLRPGLRPVGRQGLGRGKKTAPGWAAAGPGFDAIPSGWL